MRLVERTRHLQADGAVGVRVASLPGAASDAPRLGLPDLEAACRFAPPRHNAFRLTFFGRHIERSAYVDASGRYDFERIQRIHEGGATLVANEVHLTSGRMLRLKQALEGWLRCHVGINCYATPRSAQGLRRHVDDHDVLIVQVEGCKHWEVFERAPLVAGRYTMDGFRAGEPSLRTTLSPGDALYLPTGFVHAARATGDHGSLHLTIGFCPPTWRSLLEAAIREQAQADPSLQAVIPPEWIDPARQGDLERVAETALSKIGAAALAAASRRLVAPLPGPTMEVLDEAPSFAELGLDTSLRLREPTRACEQDGLLTVQAKGGRRLDLIPALSPCWAEITRRRTFRPRDLVGLVVEGKETLLCHFLADNGFLARAEA